MSNSSLHTAQLQLWAQRIRAGDRCAPDELLRATADRLERLTRKMLGRFPSVRRWEQTADVMQNASLRLLRALQQIDPTSVRDFFGLAAEQIRRELLDLVRHHYGPTCHAAHHHTHGPEDSVLEPAARGTRPPNWSAGVPSTRRSSGCRTRNARWSGSSTTTAGPASRSPNCSR
jgi:hypothetical protein